MSKLVGSIFVLGASSLIGFMMAERLNERSRLLRVMLRLLNILKTEIGYHTRLLAEVFNRAARLIDHPNLALSLEAIAKNIEFGADFNIAELWGRFLQEKELRALLKEDLSILKEMGAYLGCTDREDQIKKIEAARAGLELNLEAADLNRVKRVRLYRYFGFAAGAVLVCWLL